MTISKRNAKTLNYQDLLSSCDIGLSSVMIKKNLLIEGCNFANTKTKEDYILWLKLSQKGVLFHGIDEFYMKWRKTEDSLSSSVIRKLIDGYLVYNKYLNLNFLKSFLYLIRLSINYLKKK